MNRSANVLLLSSAALALAVAACSSNSTPSAPLDGGSTPDAAKTTDVDSGTDAGSGLTTIAAAIQGNVTTPITVKAVVTGLHGAIPSDISEWYIEDPNGGPNSGVVVYCDPDKTACPTAIRAPVTPWSVVEITGSITTYKGQREFVPTAQTILQDGGTPPPFAAVTMADIAPDASSDYRGVLVQITPGTTLTVDNVTPPALRDTSCTTIIGGGPSGGDAGTDADVADAANTDSGNADAANTDSGASDGSGSDSASSDASEDDATGSDDAASDGGGFDATVSDGGGADGGSMDAGVSADAATSDGGGLLSCAELCEPPAYSGFTANDGHGNEVNIEALFFSTDPLQSSPECLTQPNVKPVTLGMTFSAMEGVLDFDPYAGQQQLSPISPSEYTTP